MAIKSLRQETDPWRAAFVEARVLERCRGHPRFPQLLDVVFGARPGEYGLVLEHGGVDLQRFLEQAGGSLAPEESRGVLAHVASALAFLHGAGLIHADVKPSNVLVRKEPSGALEAKLADLGGVLEADPRVRVQVSATVQTMWWRAPEVLFGSKEYGASVDLWSLGMVLAEMGGWRFASGLQEKTATEVGTIMALFRQLGAPELPELTCLPAFPKKGPKCSKRPWPEVLPRSLGAAGLGLLGGLLQWAPAARPTANQVLGHGYLAPQRFALLEDPAGGTVFQGSRHAWNIRVGAMGAEVVAWLRADKALQPGTPEHLALGVDFEAQRKDAGGEEGRKFRLAGTLGLCGTTSMCGLSLARGLPLPRLRAWRAAFLAINARALAEMEVSAKAAVQRLSPDDRGKNGDQFLNLSLEMLKKIR